ncbi:GNAT family N-acetyltransferase [Paenibacillus tuaregi]|uniref:GNAT family N-acetyltransferase n=1 Tax=Paenibacillus tuaregi TaxID=1816681 RepID=UPI000838F295|nr:GNAT family protein [Paenibacillus tuaregi]
MSYLFKPMDEAAAEQMAKWVYPPPYDFYNFEYSEETIDELMNGEYWHVLGPDGQTAGFFCSGESARLSSGYKAGIYEDDTCVDIGLGLKPSLTGAGLGVEFVAEGLEFIRKQVNPNGVRFRLAVAEFNHRAIKVYERCGFESKRTVISMVNGQEVPFIYMERR